MFTWAACDHKPVSENREHADVIQGSLLLFIIYNYYYYY